MTKNKKILYLVTQTEAGGAQKYIFDLAINLKKKYSVEVGAGKGEKTKWLQELEKQNIKVHYIKNVVREINLWHDFWSVWGIYFLLLKSKPDIVHLNSSKMGVSGSMASYIYKKLHNKKLKIIYTVHGFVFSEPLSFVRKKIYLCLEKWTSIFKDKLICVSEFDKITGLNYHVADHKKFVTIHNGIDCGKGVDFLPAEKAKQELQEINGFLVEPAKPSELAKRIEELIDNEELRKQMSKNNLEKIKKFSLDKMIKETEEVYNQN
jgi:glycosyltransferase involved in cell wall biosynthesis